MLYLQIGLVWRIGDKVLLAKLPSHLSANSRIDLYRGIMKRRKI